MRALELGEKERLTFLEVGYLNRKLTTDKLACRNLRGRNIESFVSATHAREGLPRPRKWLARK